MGEKNNGAAINQEIETVSEEATTIDKTMFALIKVAQQYKRNIAECLDEARTACCLNEEIASSCGYAVPRAGGFIKGPSIRQAEIMASAWGRMMLSGQPIREDSDFVYAEGMCIDLQKMTGIKIIKKKSIRKRNGQRYDNDGIANAANGCVSIAMRDSVFRVIGKAYVDDVYRSAMVVSTGGQLPIEERRANAITWFTKLGVAQDRILLTLKHDNIMEITIEDLETLSGIRTAIKEGETTIEEVFPPVPVAQTDGEKHKMHLKPKAWEQPIASELLAEKLGKIQACRTTDELNDLTESEHFRDGLTDLEIFQVNSASASRRGSLESSFMPSGTPLSMTMD